MQDTNTSLANRKSSLPGRVAELYPLRYDRDVEITLRALLTDERDGQGRRLLAARPDEIEYRRLDTRLRALNEHLAPAKKGDIAKEIGQLLIGFGGGKSDETAAAAVLTQYTKVLAAMPIWAIKRACGRFERREVTAEEVGGKLDTAFAPSATQLYTVVEKSVRDFQKERVDILDVRRGVLEQKISEEERERVAAKMKELSQQLHAGVDTENEQRKGRGFKRLSDADLRAAYPPRAAAAEDDAT